MKLANLVRGTAGARVLRLAVAASLTAASGGASVLLAGPAGAAPPPAIWVCKFVGPQGAEVLKEGKQPIRTANPSADELIELFDDRQASYVVEGEDSTCDATPRVADLQIEKGRSPASVVEGGSITYTLTVTNRGSGAATNGFKITDLLAAGQTATSVEDDHAGLSCVTGPPVSCTFSGTFAAGEDAVVTIVATVPVDHGAGSISNTGKVTTVDDVVLDEDTVSTDVRVRTCQERDDCPVPDPTCATDASLCPVPDPTCATDASLCPVPDPTCPTTPSLCPPPADNPPLDPPATGNEVPIGDVVDAPATGQEPTDGAVTPPAAEPVDQPVDQPADQPVDQPADQPVAPPVSTPITGVEVEPAAAPARPRTLPFTGSSTDAMLALSAGLSLAGLALALAGRRRRIAD